MTDGNGNGNGNGKHRKSTGLKPPWPKGVSGNPAGRKPGVSVTRLIREELEKAEKSTPDQTVAAAVARALIDAALGGDVKACAIILDRIDGKVPDRIEEVRREIRARFPWESTEEEPSNGNGNGNGHHPAPAASGTGNDSPLPGTLPRRGNGSAGR